MCNHNNFLTFDTGKIQKARDRVALGHSFNWCVDCGSLGVISRNRNPVLIVDVVNFNWLPTAYRCKKKHKICSVKKVYKRRWHEGLGGNDFELVCGKNSPFFKRMKEIIPCGNEYSFNTVYCMARQVIFTGDCESVQDKELVGKLVCRCGGCQSLTVFDLERPQENVVLSPTWQCYARPTALKT